MIEAVRLRRSIRKYEAREIEPELISELKEAVLRSPSSQNRKPWRFVFVTDRDLLVALSTAKRTYSGFLAESALGVVMSANETMSDCWIEDCSIAATILELTATSLGLGSCWIQIRGRDHADGRSAEEHVREILGLPDEFRVLSIVSLGYPAEDRPPRKAEDLAWERVVDA